MTTKFINKDGIARVRVISPGQGSSAYYKEDQLARDGSAFTRHWDEAGGGWVGGMVYIDHPSKSDRKERPERSLHDLLGPVVGTPTFDKNGPKGPGLYSEFKVAPHWRPFVEGLAEDIGVSLMASGSAYEETIGGKKTKVVEKFNPGAGFDLVTRSGRGGRMVPLFEAATEAANTRVSDWMRNSEFMENDGRSEEERFMDFLETEPKGEGDKMELIEAQAKLIEAEGTVVTLTGANETLTKENAKLAEALALRDAKGIIAEAVNDKKHELPDVTKTRLIESLTKSAPMKEGKLDEEALKTLIESAVKDAKEYIESLTKTKPGVVGMGESAGHDEDEADHEARVARKAASYFAERKGTEEECKRMAELFYS